jgi:hypothetical protein
MTKKKNVILALPGRSYSGTFMTSMTETVVNLMQQGYGVKLVNDYSSFVTFSRMKTLGLSVLRGADQKPFDAKEDYDVWVTIDSDIAFNAQQVIKLIEDTDKYPVISGLYRMIDMEHVAAIKNWDEAYFKKHGTFEFIKAKDVAGMDEYTEVAYNGMGFFACTRKVLEDDKLKYPYFTRPLVEMKGDNGKLLRDSCSEDVAFCRNLQDAGYKIMVNTKLVVGHEKTITI